MSFARRGPCVVRPIIIRLVSSIPVVSRSSNCWWSLLSLPYLWRSSCRPSSESEKQAKTVACQSNLCQWSLVLSMYTNEHDGRFFLPTLFLGGPSANSGAWPYQLRAYRPDSNDLLLCAAASRHQVRTDVTRAFIPIRESLGSTTTAWKIQTQRPELTFSGSYGFNGGLIGFYQDEFRGYRHYSRTRSVPTCSIASSWALT